MKQMLHQHFNTHNPKLMLLNSAYFLMWVALCARLISTLFAPYGLLSTFGVGTWNITEFLINYQGGFVRRGLMGEILFFFAKNFNINVVWTIKIFCLICCLAVFIFFIKSFLKKGYPLYILPLCFFLGGIILANNWIRKDYLFFCFFIPILWFYNKNNLSILIKFLIINILFVFIVLCHEIIGFFALPILFLLIFNQYKRKGNLQAVAISSLCLLPSIVAFFLVILMHGNYETAQAIWDSWHVITNQVSSKVDLWNATSVSAIAWSSKWVVAFHLKSNFLADDQSIFSSLVWVIILPVVYYITTNTLLVFRKVENDFTNQHKTVLSSVLIFQLLCLSPVFAVLSNDYIRIYFYWITSSFSIFLLIPIEKIEKLFPAGFIHVVEYINNMLANILRPSKTTLVFLMMFIGISGCGFALELGFLKTTMLYNVLWVLSKPLLILRDFLLSMF